MDKLGQTDGGAANPVWTLKVKEALGQIAGEINSRSQGRIETIYTKAAPGVREFLFDVVWWYRNDAQVPSTEWMALAAEVEWASERSYKNADEIKQSTVQCISEDFAKLIVCKAPLKLMIFCTDDKILTDNELGEVQKAVFEEIDRNLSPYRHHIPGEHYIFVDVASNDHRRGWVRSVDSEGHMGELTVLK